MTSMMGSAEITSTTTDRLSMAMMASRSVTDSMPWFANVFRSVGVWKGPWIMIRMAPGLASSSLRMVRRLQHCARLPVALRSLSRSPKAMILSTGGLGLTARSDPVSVLYEGESS